MSKRPTDHLEPSAKKRASDRQLTQDDASSDEEEVGLLEAFPAKDRKIVIAVIV